MSDYDASFENDWDYISDTCVEDENANLREMPTYCREKNRIQYCLKFAESLKEARNAEMCDGVIKVDGQEFPVHRIVLKVSSPYFRAMFAGAFNEREKKYVELHDVKKDAFEVILDYIYGGPAELTEDNLRDVYEHCDMLCIDSMLDECKDYLRLNCFLMDDKLAAYLLAKRMELTDTADAIIEYFRREFTTVIQKSYFLKMPYEVVREVLEMNTMSTHVIENAVDALVVWVTHDPNIRFPKLDILLSKIHLDQVPNGTIKKLVAALGTVALGDESLISDRDVLVEKIQFNSTFVQQLLCKFQLKLLCLSSGLSTASMGEFHHSTLKWTNHYPSIGIRLGDHELPSTFTMETIQVVALLRGTLYIFGSKTVLGYDLTTKMTSVLAPLPHERLHFCVVAYESTMIVVGGHRQEVLRYNFVSDSWQVMCRWRHPRCHLGAALHNDIIYMLGGRTGKKSNSVKYFLSYDSSLKKFIRLTKLDRYMDNPFLVAFGKKLYVFGKEITNPEVSELSPHKKVHFCQIYDIEKKTWSDSNAKILFGDNILNVAPVADGILVVLANKEENEMKITVNLYAPECDCLDYVACLPYPQEPLVGKYFIVDAG